jgi:hypothetical protein
MRIRGDAGGAPRIDVESPDRTFLILVFWNRERAVFATEELFDNEARQSRS